MYAQPRAALSIISGVAFFPPASSVINHVVNRPVNHICKSEKGDRSAASGSDRRRESAQNPLDALQSAVCNVV
jgi:hypothetical protein